jgi:hypothetical protein
LFFPLDFPTKTLYAPHLTNACYMTYPSKSPWLVPLILSGKIFFSASHYFNCNCTIQTTFWVRLY